MFLAIVFTFFAIISVILFKKYARMVYVVSKLPGPLAYPIIGNAMMFVNKTPSEIYKNIFNTIVKYKGATRFWIGPHVATYLTDQKAVELLLSSPTLIEKSDEYNAMRPWLNDGLLISKGKKWHQRRKIITPAFHFKILEQFLEVFDKQGRILLDILSKYKPEDKVELLPIISLYALDVICETSMGTPVNAQLNSTSNYVNAVRSIAHILHLRMFNMFLKIDFTFRLSKYSKMQDDALKILHGFTDKVIQERRQDLIKESNRSSDDIQNDLGIKKKMAFLDILLQSTIEGQPLSDLDIREEVDTFMFEGHDTTISGITFTLYNLAKYPDIQQKCYEEIIDVFGTDNERNILLTEFNNLHYLEKVIKESMRIFPPVPQIGRYMREDVTLNGITLPAGGTITIPIITLGRNPDVFPDPMEFKPERFDNASMEKKNAFAYIPFSAGSRNCIGQKFAMLEMKSVVSKVLQKFKIRLNEDSVDEPVLIAELVLKPDSKIYFHLEERK